LPKQEYALSTELHPAAGVNFLHLFKWLPESVGLTTSCNLAFPFYSFLASIFPSSELNLYVRHRMPAYRRLCFCKSYYQPLRYKTSLLIFGVRTSSSWAQLLLITLIERRTRSKVPGTIINSTNALGLQHCPGSTASYNLYKLLSNVSSSAMLLLFLREHSAAKTTGEIQQEAHSIVNRPLT
jgi:hypothetical protein